MRAQSHMIKVHRGWKKPPEGKQMVNNDVWFVAGIGSLGVVIRDSSGGFVAASMSFLSTVLEAPMVLVFINAHIEFHKHVDTVIAFTQEYSTVSYLSTRKQW